MPVTDGAPARFLLGANLPWVRYGCDFGDNAWNAGGLRQRADRERLGIVLRDLAARGVTAVRWFVFCDGRSGIDFDAGGAPMRLQPSVFDDFACALDLVESARMRIVPVLFDFTWCSSRRLVNGVSLGGRVASWQNPSLRERLYDTVVRPFAARFAASEAVLAWDLLNEPEWFTRGAGTRRPWRSLSAAGTRQLLAGLGACLRAAGARTITVGSASTRWLWLMRDLGLDVYQPHWYDHMERDAPLARPLASLHLDRPAWLGELPTRHSQRAPDVIFRVARQAGYAGAFFWSALAEDHASDFDAASSALVRWARGDADGA